MKKQNPTFTPEELSALKHVFGRVLERLEPDGGEGWTEKRPEGGKGIYFFSDEKEAFDSAVKKIMGDVSGR